MTIHAAPVLNVRNKKYQAYIYRTGGPNVRYSVTREDSKPICIGTTMTRGNLTDPGLMTEIRKEIEKAEGKLNLRSVKPVI